MPDSESVKKIVLITEKRCEEVIEHLNQLIQEYKFVTLADLYALVGLPSTAQDGQYGWASTEGITIEEISYGFSLRFPEPETYDNLIKKNTNIITDKNRNN